MLDKLRQGAGTWIAKIFIGLLVLSFAVWGIADIFGGYGAQTIAKVGDQKVSTEDYRIAYQDELQRLSYQLGRRVTSEQARLLGLENQVLARLVNIAAMDTHAAELGLGISDDAIAKRIQRDPVFAGPDGKFSRRAFDEGLAQVGLSEQGYVHSQRESLVRRQITEALISDLKAPQTLLDAYNDYRNETRELAYFLVPPDSIEEVSEPDESTLKAYYEDHKRSFTAPEFRALDLLVVTPESLRVSIQISNEELKQEYESQQESYTTPEKRRIEQIAFQNKESAEKAHKDLQSGKDYKEVAKLAGQTESDIDLGIKSENQLADSKIAEAAFGLAKDTISEPIEGTFSTVILRVTEIEPKKTRTYEEVKEEIKDRLTKERAANEVLDLNDTIEDERAAGSTLEEISAKLNLKKARVQAVDRSGKDPEGKTIADIPNSARILRTAFDSDVGVENDPIDLDNGGFVWVDVTEVIPEKLKPFDKVKPEAKKSYIADKRSIALAENARALAERAKSGIALVELAKEIGSNRLKTDPIKRSGRIDGLSPAAIAQAFSLPQGGTGSALSSDDKGRAVFKVLSISAPEPLSESERKGIDSELSRQVSNALLSEYTTALRDRYGVTINEQLFQHTIGSGQR